MAASGYAIAFIAGLCVAFTIFVFRQVFKEYKRIQNVRRNPFIGPKNKSFSGKFQEYGTKDVLDTLNHTREYRTVTKFDAGVHHTTQIHYQNHDALTVFFGTCSCGWMTTTLCQDADEVSKALDAHYLSFRDDATNDGTPLRVN